MDNQKIGIINEIGDLGLGFDPITKKEQEILEESQKEKEETENK